MNKIWIIIIVASSIYGIFFGDIEILITEVLNVPHKALSTLMMIGGILIFWNGLFHIAIDSGLINSFSKVMRPLTKRLFKSLPDNHSVHDYIATNLAANLLGLGNAATPMGIKALQEMKALNNDSNEASPAMITFILLNTVSFAIFPVTIFSIRQIYKSKLNMHIYPYLIICNVILFASALLINKIFIKVNSKSNV